MYNNNKISCVIPCYNEEAGLKIIFHNKPSCVDEVVIVDNNSTDNTSEVASKNGAVVVYENRRGYGQAYKAGLPRASGDIVITLDGDGSYSMLEIEKILEYFNVHNLDFLVGCRYPLINKSSQPFINRIANSIFSWMIRAIFGINLADSQSGMMVFKKNILDKIMVNNVGMGFSQEIKIKAFLNKGIKCGSCRILYIPRVGKSKFRKIHDSLNAILSVIAMWWQLVVRTKNKRVYSWKLYN